jgi:hypothetical protein
MANTEAVPDLFAAVAGQATSPRYATLPPPPGGETVADRPALGDCTDTGQPIR